MTPDPVTHGPRGPRSAAPASSSSSQPPSPPPRPARPWWHDAVVYQIYPRSFADANGDGTGDLRGVTSRVPYLAALGVDAVWLSPFYPSALADGGYDVDDYRDVAPELGTLADFDEMTRALHEAGIRVMVDLVPNHTSDRHAWFRAALEAGPGSPERERYHFRPGSGAGGSQPPSDWRSMFGGSAWQRVEDRAADGTPLTGPGADRPWQWYLHLFTPQQPDLNWDHPEVRAEFLDVLRFWADRGVDGFRVDVAPGLVKDLSQPYRPAAEIPWWPLPDDGSHPLFDRDAVHEIYRGWRRLLDSYDPPRLAVAEAGVVASRRPAYAHSLGQAFNFQLQDADFTSVSFRWAVEAGLADLEASGTTTWVLGCHDTPRLATRLGFDLADDVAPEHEDPTYLGGVSQRMSRVWIQHDGTRPANDAALGLRRARAAALLEMALPGAMYLYQGDELGLPEVPDIPEDRLQDPIAFRMRGVEKGRDGCRVPLPWTVDGLSYGFGPDLLGPGRLEPGRPGSSRPGPAGSGSGQPGPGSGSGQPGPGSGSGQPGSGSGSGQPGSGPGSLEPSLGHLDSGSMSLDSLDRPDPGPDRKGDPHLPQPAGWGRLSVEAQEADASSTLALYRRGLALRRRYWGAANAGGLAWLETPEHVLAFERGGVQCWTAFGAPVDLPAGEVLLASEPVLPAGGPVEELADGPVGGPGACPEGGPGAEPAAPEGVRDAVCTAARAVPSDGQAAQAGDQEVLRRRAPQPGAHAARPRASEGRSRLVLPADATAWLLPAGAH